MWIFLIAAVITGFGVYMILEHTKPVTVRSPADPSIAFKPERPTAQESEADSEKAAIRLAAPNPNAIVPSAPVPSSSVSQVLDRQYQEWANLRTWAHEYHRIVYGLIDLYYRNVDPVLVAAIIEVESRYSKTAIREERDENGNFIDWSVGLMQIRTDTARWVWRFPSSISAKTIRNYLYDPELNITIGTMYLSWQTSRYQTHDPAMLAASYNAGSIFVKDDGSFSNQKYVNRVLGAMKIYQNSFPPLRST